LHSLGFDPADLDVDLSEKRCLVTGANSGIGFETALSLADLGAEVVLLCRSHAKGTEAANKIRTQTGNNSVSVDVVDMSDQKSIRAAAKRLSTAPVHVLVHNAGVLPEHRLETDDEQEMTFATHVSGPFLLTQLLHSSLEKADGARVVWVSSGGMYTKRLNLRDPQWIKRKYDGVAAYAETKRAQVILSELWAKKLRGSRVVVNAMHPGWADTPSVESSLPLFHRITRQILRTPAEGADTVVWLAAAERTAKPTGKFFFDRLERTTHFLSSTKEDAKERQALWRLCDQLTMGSAE
jgi:NAD(P)-dependent dehydrogenase (short-subunit alcohol dehydrogenase family)